MQNGKRSSACAQHETWAPSLRRRSKLQHTHKHTHPTVCCAHPELLTRGSCSCIDIVLIFFILHVIRATTKATTTTTNKTTTSIKLD